MLRSTNDLERMRQSAVRLDRLPEENITEDSGSTHNSCCERLQVWVKSNCEQTEIIELPEKHRVRVQYNTYRAIRWWSVVLLCLTTFASITGTDFTWDKTRVRYILGNVMIGICSLSLIHSFCFDNTTSAIVVAYVYQLRILMNLTVPIDYTSTEKKRFTANYNLVNVTIVAFFNMYFIVQINPWRPKTQYFFNL